MSPTGRSPRGTPLNEHGPKRVFSRESRSGDLRNAVGRSTRTPSPRTARSFDWNDSGLSASSPFRRGRSISYRIERRDYSPQPGWISRLRRITSPSLRRARTSLSPGIRLYWPEPMMDGESILLATLVRRRLPSGSGSKCAVSRERRTDFGYIPLEGVNQKTGSPRPVIQV